MIDINDDDDDDDDGAQSASHWLAAVPFRSWMATPSTTCLGLAPTAWTEKLASMSYDLRCELEVPDRVQLRAVGLGYKNLALASVRGDNWPTVRALSSTAAEIASSWGGRSLFDSSG